ncbi:unnamed protein product, partial [Caenorhabditis brenneri]
MVPFVSILLKSYAISSENGSEEVSSREIVCGSGRIETRDPHTPRYLNSQREGCGEDG